jgi:hypothetical protein
MLQPAARSVALTGGAKINNGFVDNSAERLGHGRGSSWIR